MDIPRAESVFDLIERTHGHALAHGNGAVSVERSVFELRRGRPVAMRDGHESVLVLPAENASDGEAAALARFAERPVNVLLSARRAKALSLGDGPVTIPWSEVLDRGVLAALAERHPDTAIRRGWLSEPKSAVAMVEVCALRLARMAGLLPVLLTVKVGAAATEHIDALVARDVLRAVQVGDILRLDQRLPPVRRLSAARVPLSAAKETRFIAYREVGNDNEHLAVVVGRPERMPAPLVRLHSSCVTGDVFGSLRCDCGQQLATSVARMAEDGGGVLLYLAQEGRGIGIVHKLRAYALQDQGLDTLEANETLGFEADERDFSSAASMLLDLGIRSVRLMTNNPDKIAALERGVIEIVERIGLTAELNPLSARYIAARVDKAGYLYGTEESAAE